MTESAVDNSLKLLERAAMSKVITPHFEQLIDKCVASGRFNNKSEVIRAGLRLLEEHEAQTASACRDDLSRVIKTALQDTRPLIPASQRIRRRRQ
jgi:antitoxin ParD1/3/4